MWGWGAVVSAFLMWPTILILGVDTSHFPHTVSTNARTMKRACDLGVVTTLLLVC